MEELLRCYKAYRDLKKEEESKRAEEKKEGEESKKIEKAKKHFAELLEGTEYQKIKESDQKKGTEASGEGTEAPEEGTKASGEGTEASEKKESSEKSRKKRKLHNHFVKYCLAPKGYKHGMEEVFAHLHTIKSFPEEGDIEYYELHFSLMTPSMIYTDCLFFNLNVEGQDNEPRRNTDKWWVEQYKPYYYEFVCFANINEYNVLKEKKLLEGCFFPARIQNKNTEKGIELSGKLYFGGSSGFSDSVIIKVLDFSTSESENKAIKCLNDLSISAINVMLQCAKHNDLANYIKNNMISQKYEVKVINVGEANCIHLKGDMNTSKSFFIDVGKPLTEYKTKYGIIDNTDYDDDKRHLKNSQSIHLSSYRPQTICVTHWHFDHVELFTELYDNGGNCNWLVPPVEMKDGDVPKRLILFLNNSGKSNSLYFIYRTDDGKIYDHSDQNTIFQIWNGVDNGDQREDLDKNVNRLSLIYRINDMLFPGDCIYQYWPDDLQRDLGRIRKLVVPHHGGWLGNDNSGEDWIREKWDKNTTVIQKMNAVDAIISYGVNGYHHPNTNHEKALVGQNFIIKKTGGATNTNSVETYMI